MLPSSPPRRRWRCGDSLARRRDRGWSVREPRGPGRGGRGAASGVRRSERRAPFAARRPELRGNEGREARPGGAAGGAAGAREGRRKGRPFCMEVRRREASTFSTSPKLPARRLSEHPFCECLYITDNNFASSRDLSPHRPHAASHRTPRQLAHSLAREAQCVLRSPVSARVARAHPPQSSTGLSQNGSPNSLPVSSSTPHHSSSA